MFGSHRAWNIDIQFSSESKSVYKLDVDFVLEEKMFTCDTVKDTKPMK